MKISSLIAVAGLVAAATSASAQVAIPGLQNTGTAGQGVIDTNYRFSVVSGTATGTACGAFLCGVATTNGSYPMDVWLPNNATSAWLTPSANQGQSYDISAPGTYQFTETFDLTGYVPGTASLMGRFLADNSATVSLNGGPVLATTGLNSFNTWTTFSAASGFVAGLNTLTFTVTNSSSPLFFPNPTGLRVEFTASSVSPIPEPSALVLSLAGLALVGGVAKRRLAQKA